MDLISRCALRAAKLLWQPGHGGFAFTVVCKATFDLRPDVSPLAAAQEPVVEADVHGGAERQSLAQASELVPFKKRPEVLVAGHAHAPEGRPVASLVARLVVGEIDKSIQVDGDRCFDADGWITDPEPFARMPLVWERAAGGQGSTNPVGVSLGADARLDANGRVAAPNLLPPGTFLTSRRKPIPPVGLGPIAPLWPSRAAFLHRHAAHWDPGRWNERPLPADVDVAYFNAAPPDQQRPEPFAEERLFLENLHPRFAQLSTRLALVTPGAIVERGAGPEPLRLRCDTLIIDTDRAIAMLVWRAHVLLAHRDEPGQVIVTGPGAPEASRSSWSEGEPQERKATVDPDLITRPKAVIPFLRSTGGPEPSSPPPVFAPPEPDVTDPDVPPSRARSVTPFRRTTKTIDPSQQQIVAPVLPFAETPKGPAPLGGGMVLRSPTAPAESAPPRSEAPAPPPPPPLDDEDRTFVGAPVRSSAMPFPVSRRPGAFSDDEHTATGIAIPSPALPFGAAPDEGAPRSSERTFGAPPLVPAETRLPTFGVPAPAPQGTSALPFGAPAFSIAADVTAPLPEPAPAPAPEVSAPAPVFVLESASSSPAPATDAEERIRLVQQAIWRGDRPTRKILAEHGLTEVEWRAMKRASARKATA